MTESAVGTGVSARQSLLRASGTVLTLTGRAEFSQPLPGLLHHDGDQLIIIVRFNRVDALGTGADARVLRTARAEIAIDGYVVVARAVLIPIVGDHAPVTFSFSALR
jgi:hypothetical protein